MLQVLWIEVAQQWICIRQIWQMVFVSIHQCQAISSRAFWTHCLALADRHKHLWRMQIHCCATSIHNTKCRICVEPFRPCGEDTWPELDCQLLHSCLLPARAASWYSLESPHTSRTWACARCGQKWGGRAKRWKSAAVEPKQFCVKSQPPCQPSLKAKWACCA